MEFNYNRRTPWNVQLVEANYPLISVGGKSLYELREDFFDQAATTTERILSPYDICMGGGEPYAKWY